MTWNIDLETLTSDKRRLAIAGGIGLALIAAGGASQAFSHEPERMSAMRVSGLQGYQVRDSAGLEVGKVLNVETDYAGRTRYVSVVLEDGAETRIAAFQAFLDQRAKTIDLVLPRDVVFMRAEATAPELSIPEPTTQIASAT